MKQVDLEPTFYKQATKNGGFFINLLLRKRNETTPWLFR